MPPTKIQWATRVWNITTGCRRISPGCEHCYAERMARRLKGMGKPQYQDVVGERGWTGQVIPWIHLMSEPYSWKHPQRVFIDSMADLFADESMEYVSLTFFKMLFKIIRSTPQHTYIILTKRPEVGLQAITETYKALELKEPLPNLWVGISAENQEYLEKRIHYLLQIMASKHFVSAEPLLGKIDFGNVQSKGWSYDVLAKTRHQDGSFGEKIPAGIDWVIAGCETGPGHRPVPCDYFKFMRDQCVENNVPFFFKQIFRNGKLVEMPTLDGKVWDQIP